MLRFPHHCNHIYAFRVQQLNPVAQFYFFVFCFTFLLKCCNTVKLSVVLLELQSAEGIFMAQLSDLQQHPAPKLLSPTLISRHFPQRSIHPTLGKLCVEPLPQLFIYLFILDCILHPAALKGFIFYLSVLVWSVEH